MAFVTICEPCLSGDHRGCLEAGWNRPSDLKVGEEWYGAALCVCAHGLNESPWQREVRERTEEKHGADPIS